MVSSFGIYISFRTTQTHIFNYFVGYFYSYKDNTIRYNTQQKQARKRLNKYFTKYDRAKAEKIMSKGQKYKNIEEKYRLEHFQRVSGDVAESVATHQIHMELMDMLKQMNIFIELIASTLLSIKEDQA